MLIDCDTCVVRGAACTDCVVTVLLGAPPSTAGPRLELDGAEQAAIAVLAGSGLVPPLRLLPATAQEPAHERAAACAVDRASPAPRRPGTRRAAG